MTLRQNHEAEWTAGPEVLLDLALEIPDATIQANIHIVRYNGRLWDFVQLTRAET